MTGRRPVVAGRQHHAGQRTDLARALARRVAVLEAENARLRIAVAVAAHTYPNPPLPAPIPQPRGRAVPDPEEHRWAPIRRPRIRRRLGGHL